MEIKEILMVFNEALNPDSQFVIDENTEFKELETWSSLSAFVLVEKIYSAFNVKIRGLEIRKCTTIKEMYDLLQEKNK